MTGPKLNEDGLPENYQFNPEWEVTPRQVKAMRDANEDFILIDCRTLPEYELCRIEGAQHMPLQEVMQHADDLEDERDKRVIIHCHHGMRSLQMTAILREMGFSDVFSMAGGIDIWSIDIDPSVPRY